MKHQNFCKKLDFENLSTVIISEEQERKWNKQLTSMVRNIQKDLSAAPEEVVKQAQEKAAKPKSITFEQMLEEDFFSFDMMKSNLSQGQQVKPAKKQN